VLTAYDELAAANMIHSRPGSGISVSGASALPQFDLEVIAKAAHYPSRQVLLDDPDGNPVAISY
jgi:DNA-binding GntR family transcriptional regulator